MSRGRILLAMTLSVAVLALAGWQGICQTKRNAKKCKTQQLDCKPGYYVVKNQLLGIKGGNAGPPSCEQCPESTFSTTVNAMKCTPWRNCQAEGMIVAKVGTSVRDHKCRNCGPGECIHTVNNCPPGNFIKMQKSQNSSLISPVCVPCPYGFFQDRSNATFCSKWSMCTLEEGPLQRSADETSRIASPSLPSIASKAGSCQC